MNPDEGDESDPKKCEYYESEMLWLIERSSSTMLLTDFWDKLFSSRVLGFWRNTSLALLAGLTTRAVAWK